MSAAYRSEAEALDREILAIIAAWRDGIAPSNEAFDGLALRVFAHQLRYNVPYARYAAALGVTLDATPASWREIPPVPAAAYKEARLATFDAASAGLVFETSGTTQGTGGRHFMESATLYDAALLAGFDRFVLGENGGVPRLRYANLVPNPQQRPHSSLGYMMARVTRERGDERTGWFLRGDAILTHELFAALREATEERQPVCVATTAFALLAVLDAAQELGLRFALPPGSRVIQTGGFKGRTRVVARDELYARTRDCFGLGESAIIAEYGMTELTSQWYSRVGGTTMAGPAWLRARAVGLDGRTLPDGVVGALAHVDLANRSSCVAVLTEDLGACFGSEIVLFGREAGAELRGCSLDAETLAAR